MKRCVIVGGAPIENYGRLRQALSEDDYLVYCDGGLRHRAGLGREPDLIVGDFDSHPVPDLPAETICLPREKDDTDTVFAAREAFRRGFRDFLLLGVLGGRLDHTMANVSILLALDELGAAAAAMDDYSQLSVVSPHRPAEVPDTWPYFSLMAMGGPARGVTITGAKFPLSEGEITSRYQYGVSNEPLPGRTARITLREGSLLLVKVERDWI